MRIQIQANALLPGKGMMKRRKLTKTYRDFATAYCKENPDMDPAVYRDVMKSFAKKLAKKIIEDQYQYSAPSRMGIIGITGHKRTSSTGPIDWKSTNAKGKLIRFTNFHSDRNVFKFRWFKGLAKNFYNRMFYQFIPSFTNRRTLTAHIRECAADPYKKTYTPKYETSPNFY